MNESANTICRRNSWLAALVVGLLVAAMLLFVAHHGVFRALVIGAVVAVLLGLFLVWAFCKAETVAVVAAEPQRPIPAPTPAPTPTPMKVAAMPAPAAPAQSERAPAAAVTTSAAPAAEVSAPKPNAAAKPKAAPKPKAVPKPTAAPKPKVAPKPKAEVKAAPEAAAPKPRTGSALDAALAKSKEPASKAGPELLTAPRGGTADNLKAIKGVGPKLEKLLNDVGVWHFDQIASWKARDIAFVDDKMQGFKGRISRDEWVKQAKVLAKGGTTEFSERVAKGDVYRGVE
jgi:predicted flap endonuclease-1-like 5' DNA nuclease